MKWILVPVFGIASLWDGFTTLYGTWYVLGDSAFAILVSSGVALIVLVLMLTTAVALKTGDEALGCIWKSLWLIAVIYDVYTSFLGNRDLLLQGFASEEQLVVLVLLTILVSGSPVMVSLLLDQ